MTIDQLLNFGALIFRAVQLVLLRSQEQEQLTQVHEWRPEPIRPQVGGLRPALARLSAASRRA